MDRQVLEALTTLERTPSLGRGIFRALELLAYLMAAGAVALGQNGQQAAAPTKTEYHIVIATLGGAVGAIFLWAQKLQREILDAQRGVLEAYKEAFQAALEREERHATSLDTVTRPLTGIQQSQERILAMLIARSGG